MLDLYEIDKANGISRRVATIPFSDVLRDFGIRRFYQIQNLLDRKIVFVRSTSQPCAGLLSQTDGGLDKGREAAAVPAPRFGESTLG